MEITKDTVAVITGASEGIGEAIARELAGRGAKVVLAARSQDKLDKLAGELPGSWAIAADMRKPEDIRRLISGALEKFGRIDLLVNNAGQGLRAPVESIPLGDYRSVMELNVFAVLDAMQLAIPVMRKQGGGMILNISSMVSKNYYLGLGGYSSTKYALNALSLTARQELAGEGIVVSVFHPRMTATQFGQNARGEQYDSSAGRPGMGVDTAQDVAREAVRQIESGAPEAMMG
jgi:short-subunit dehydrogenase